MERGYILLIGLCILAIYVLILNLKVISSNRYTLLKVVCTLLFVFSILRYLTLIVYGDKPTYDQLVALRYFYFATSIGLTLPTAAAVWYVTPLYRGKIKYPYYLVFFLPWIIFYLKLILTQPTHIVQGSRFGYVLELVEPYPIYLSVAQGSFVMIMVVLALIGILKYRSIQIRVQLFVIIVAQMMLTLDGLSYLFEGITTIPPFTVSEIAGFLAVYYAFKVRLIEVKGIKNK